MKTNIHFSAHPSRCTGCGACVMACINENNIDIDRQPPFRLLKQNEYGDGEALSITWFVHGCMHCADAPCMEACPRHCFTREGEFGLVRLDPSNCIGCRRCEKACAFGAISFVNIKAQKCHGCLERLRDGELPLCVQACPRRALTIDEKNQVAAQGCEELKKELQTYRAARR